MKTRRCKECGDGVVRSAGGKGRFMRYKTAQQLEIPEHVEIATCDNCGAEWIDPNTAKVVDAAMEQTYREDLRLRVRVLIERIARDVTQQRVEQVLGLSHGYLSKLKAGDRDPRADLVSELALLARDPLGRIAELEAYWSQASGF